jgi:hypothetical protein
MAISVAYGIAVVSIGTILTSTLHSFALQAFAPSPSFFSKAVVQSSTPTPSFFSKTVVQSSTLLEACRTNAKKEKIKRNRENMRKFRTGGKKGVSRRKLLKKAQSSKARQEEAEFIVKCYMTVPPPATNEDSNSK